MRVACQTVSILDVVVALLITRIHELKLASTEVPAELESSLAMKSIQCNLPDMAQGTNQRVVGAAVAVGELGVTTYSEGAEAIEGEKCRRDVKEWIRIRTFLMGFSAKAGTETSPMECVSMDKGQRAKDNRAGCVMDCVSGLRGKGGRSSRPEPTPNTQLDQEMRAYQHQNYPGLSMSEDLEASAHGS